MFNTNCYGNESIPSYTQGVETPWPSHTTHSNQNLFQHPVASNPNAFVGYGLGQVQSKELDLAGVVGMKETSGTTSTPATSNAWHHSHRMRYSSTAATTRGFLPYQMSSLTHYDGQSVDTSHLTHGTHHQFWVTNPNAAYTLMHNYNQRDHNTYSERGETSRNTATIRHNTAMPNRNYAVEDQSRNVNATLQQQPAEALSQHCQRQSRQQIHQLQQHQQMHHQQDYLRNQLSQRDREPCQYTSSSYHQESMRVGVDPTLYHDQHVLPTTQQHQHQQYQASQEALRKAETERRTVFTSRQAWSQTWAKPAYVPFDTSQAFLSNHRSTGSAFQPCNKQVGTDPYSMDSIWAKSAVPTPTSHVAHATNHSIPPTNNHIPMPAQSWLHDTTSHLKSNVYRPPQEINQVTNVPSNFSTNVLNLDTGQVELSMSVLPPDLSLYTQAVPQTQRHRTSTSHPVPVPVQPRHRHLPAPAVPQNQIKPVVKEAPAKPVESSRPTSTARAAGLDVRQFLATWDEDVDIATPRPATIEIDEPEPPEPSSTTSLVVLDYQTVPSEEAAGLLQMYPGLQLNGNDPVMLLDNTPTKTNLDFVLSRAVTTTTSTETVSGTVSDVQVNQYTSAIVVQPPTVGCTRSASPAIPEKPSNGNHIEEIQSESNENANVEERQVDLSSQPSSQEAVTPVSACESDSERNKKTSLRHFRKRKAVSMESDASSQYSEQTDEVPTKCVKTDNNLSNWFGNDSMDTTDGPIRTPVSVSSGACDLTSSAAQSPVDPKRASEDKISEAPNTSESTPVSVIAMNRNVREEIGRSMPDIFNDEMDQETCKIAEVEYHSVINISRGADYSKKFNEVVSELSEIKSQESTEKSKKQQAGVKDLSSCDSGFRESCDGVEQTPPQKKSVKMPDVELENDFTQQSSETAGEELINKQEAFRDTYQLTILTDQESTSSTDRELCEKSDHRPVEKSEIETCEKSDSELSKILDGQSRDNSGQEPSDISTRAHNEVKSIDLTHSNLSDYEIQEPSDLTNQMASDLMERKSDGSVNREPFGVKSRELGDMICESDDLTRDLDEFADRDQDDSFFQDHIPDNFENSHAMDSSIRYSGDPRNQESGDLSHRNSDDFGNRGLVGCDSQERDDFASCKRFDYSRREPGELFSREQGDFVDRDVRDCENNDPSESENLHCLDSILNDLRDSENREPGDTVSEIISDSRNQKPIELGNQKTFSSDNRESNDSNIEGPSNVIGRKPSDLSNLEPSGCENSKTSDILSPELCDGENQHPIDCGNQEISDLGDRKIGNWDTGDIGDRKVGDTVDQETGEYGEKETGDIGDPKTCDIGDQETSDIGDQETSDIGDQETSDIGDQETSDIGDQETSDIGDRDTGDIIDRVAGDMGDRETSDMGDRETSDIGDREIGDAGDRETSDIGGLEIGSIVDQETDDIVNRKTDNVDEKTDDNGDQNTGGIGERKTGDFGNQEACDIGDRVTGDIGDRVTGDIGDREPGDTVGRETGDHGNRETSNTVAWETGNRETADLEDRKIGNLRDRDTGQFEDQGTGDSDKHQPGDFEYMKSIEFCDARNPEPEDDGIRDPGETMDTGISVNVSEDESNDEPPDNMQGGDFRRSASKANTEPSIDSLPLKPDTILSGVQENEERVTSIAKANSTRTASDGCRGTTKYLSRMVRSAPGKIPKILLSRLKDARDKTRRNRGVKKLPSIRLTRVQTSTSLSVDSPPEYVCQDGEFPLKSKDDADLPNSESHERREEEVRKTDIPVEQVVDSKSELFCSEESTLQSRSKSTSPVPEESLDCYDFGKRTAESSTLSPNNASACELVNDTGHVEDLSISIDASVLRSCHSPSDEDWASVFGHSSEASGLDLTTNKANDCSNKDAISRPTSPFEKRMSSGQLLRNKSPDASAVMYQDQDFTRLRPIRRRPIPKRRFSLPSPKSFEEDVTFAQKSHYQGESGVSINVFKFTLQPVRNRSVSTDASVGSNIYKTTFETNKEPDHSKSDMAVLGKIHENRKENSWSSEEDSSDMIVRETYKKSLEILKEAPKTDSDKELAACSSNDALEACEPREVSSRRDSESPSISISHESRKHLPTRHESPRKSSSKEWDSSSSDEDDDSSCSSASDSSDTDTPINESSNSEKDNRSAGEEDNDNITDDIARPVEELVSNQADAGCSINEMEESKCFLESSCSDAEAITPLDNSQSVVDDILVADVSSEPNLEKAENLSNSTSNAVTIEPLVELCNTSLSKETNEHGVIDSSNSDAVSKLHVKDDSCPVSEKLHEEVIVDDPPDSACPSLDPIDPEQSLSISSQESKEMPCLDCALLPGDTSDRNEKTDMTKCTNHIDVIDGTDAVVDEDTLLVFTDSAEGVFVDGEDGCAELEVQDEEDAEEYHIVVDAEQYEGLCNGTMEVHSDESLKTFTVENIKKADEQILEEDSNEEVHRDQGDYYCDEIGSAPVEEVVNSETACDIEEEEVFSSWQEEDVNPMDVIAGPLESVRNRPFVEVSEKEETHMSRQDILLEVKCSLSWDRILNEGQGLVLGPANVEVRVPGEALKENTHWKVVTRERKRPGTSKNRACVEENNNVMPDVKSPIVVVKRLVLKRPRTKRFQRKREDQDALEDLWKDSAKTLPPLKTKAALKAFQAQTEVKHVRNRNRSWPTASGMSWKRGNLKRRRSDWSPPAQNYSCASPQRLPKVIIKKTGPQYQSFICGDDVVMQPVVTIERNAELDNLALNMWSDVTSTTSSGGESLKDDRLTLTKDTEFDNASQLNGSVHRRKRSQSKDGRAGQLMKVVELLQQWRQAEQEAACKGSTQSECGDTKENNNSLLCVDNNADDDRYLHRFHSSNSSSSVISSPDGSVTNDCSYTGIPAVNHDEESSSFRDAEDKGHVEYTELEDRVGNLENNVGKEDVQQDNIVEEAAPEKSFLGGNVDEDSTIGDVLEDNIIEENVLEDNIVEENVQDDSTVEDILEDIAVQDRVQEDIHMQQDVHEDEIDDVTAQGDDIIKDGTPNKNFAEKSAEHESVVREVTADDAISKSIFHDNTLPNDLVEKIVGDIVQEYNGIGKVGTSTLQEADSVLQDSTVQEPDSAFEENRLSGTTSAFQEEVVVREADSVLPENVHQQDVEVSCTEKDILGENVVSHEQSRRTSIEDVLGSPLVCQVCGFTTTLLEEQANHIRTHSYHCQRCQLAFLSHENFKDHLAAEHPTIEELHHCLLCQRTFPTAERHSQHKKGWHHSQMERSQRHTIHSLYRYFTGNECPYLPSLAPEESKAFDWLPSDPGVIHFYHDATPLQLAIQDCEGAKGDTETC